MSTFQSNQMKHCKSLILLSVFSCMCLSCQKKVGPGIMTVLTPMPKKITESSGLASYDTKHVWTIEDSGNKDEIYKIDFKGKIVKELKVKNGKNIDWEDLTTDSKGNLYIGDFGNNKNKRKDLVIYKLPHPDKEKGEKIVAEKIVFHYPEQDKFPPKKSKRYFDAEAFFHWEGFLYVVTRNRSTPFDGKAFIYKIPDVPGKYKAKKVGEVILCTSPQSRCEVTSATISKNGNQIVLLTYTSLWVFENFTLDDFSDGKMTKIFLETPTQQESVAFLNEDTVLISDEKNFKNGGNLYKLNLAQFLEPEAKPKREP